MEIMIYKETLGYHISRVLQEMAEWANEQKCHVVADFNDLLLAVKPGDDIDLILADYHEKSEKRHQEYINSDKYKEQEKRGIAEGVEKQKIAEDNFEAILLLTPERNAEAIIRHLKVFTDVTDNVYVKFDNVAAAHKLIDKGYVKSEFVGDDAITAWQDPIKCLRYLMGQAIDCMLQGMPPLPVTIVYCDNWLLHFAKK